jgi:16S rRNA (adenine1518-N6/adenine1519-N6)-dimethyltransferase
LTTELNLTDYQTLRNILKQYRVWTKKRLGQHFLVDETVLTKIIEAAELNPGEHITEIGAGAGVLTRALLKTGVKVDAVEIDESMLPVLNYTTKGFRHNLTIHRQHILGFEQTNFPFKVVANIPYHLSSPILRKFLVESATVPELIVLLIQREVAEKICNKTKKSILSLFVEVFGEAEIVETVPASSFMPPPKVESVILKIKTHSKPLINIDKKIFFKVVKSCFTAPRKMLKNTLKNQYKIFLEKEGISVEELLDKTGIEQNVRPENLQVADWERLAKLLYSC